MSILDDNIDKNTVSNEADTPNDVAFVDIDAMEKRERFEQAITRANNPWGLTPKAIEAQKAAMTMLSTKNGLHARVPLICKADSCPYADTCQLLPYNMAPEGEYCPIELAQIDIRTQGYFNDIDFDKSSFTDKVLMNELVTLDIMLERAKALMAKEGTPVIEMSIGIDQDGNEIKQPGVSKAWEAYEKISKKRNDAYQLLMLTRKDKKSKGADDGGESISQAFQDIINEGSLYNIDDEESSDE